MAVVRAKRRRSLALVAPTSALRFQAFGLAGMATSRCSG
jgi:hypothetical protein